jgi:hypothetical protein
MLMGLIRTDSTFPPKPETNRPAVLLTLLLPVLVLVAPIVSFESARATAQVCEKLIIGDSTFDLATTPLELFLDSIGRRPEFACSGHKIVSSNNWRGYVATWRIDRDSLWLMKIEMKCPTETGRPINQPPEYEYHTLPIDSFVPGQKGPVFARWFTGMLRIPTGKMIRYVHMGFGSVYESETQFRI